MLIVFINPDHRELIRIRPGIDRLQGCQFIPTRLAAGRPELEDHGFAGQLAKIDLFTAPELKKTLADAIENGASRVVVDLSETTFLDSTALGVLIGAVKRLRSRDGQLVIVNTDANIAKTFEITGLDQIFTILGDRDSAVGALDAA